MVQQITGFRLLVGRGNLVGLGGDKLTEQRIVPGCLGNLHHVAGSGIMLLIMETIGIIKMCVFTAELCSSLVHQLNELLYRTAGFLGQCQSHFIGRFQHQSHNSLFYSKDLPGFCIDGRASGLNAVGSSLGHSETVIHIQILTDQQCSHDLGNTCRI